MSIYFQCTSAILFLSFMMTPGDDSFSQALHVDGRPVVVVT